MFVTLLSNLKHVFVGRTLLIVSTVFFAVTMYATNGGIFRIFIFGVTEFDEDYLSLAYDKGYISDEQLVPLKSNDLEILIPARENYVKRIFLQDPEKRSKFDIGHKNFENCTVFTCVFINDVSQRQTADAVLIVQKPPALTSMSKPQGQTWIFMPLENPVHPDTHQYAAFKNLINWTISYRADSTIPNPVGHYAQDHSIKLGYLPEKPFDSYAKGKTKMVAWYVSKCQTPNLRMDYAKELSKHIQVDRYGECGNLKCGTGNRVEECWSMFEKDYKFYLAFEEVNCQHYITRTFFRDALVNTMLPIVMGARVEDYDVVAPVKSYLHVDNFQSPKHLAEYLHELDADEDKYNVYFRWKEMGAVITDEKKVACNLCALLQAEPGPIWKPDFMEWWAGKGVCIEGNKWSGRSYFE